MKLTDVRSDWPRVERTAERTNEWIWSGLLRCSGSDCVKCKNSRVTLGICMIILINKPCIGSFIPPHSRMSCNHNGHEHVHASRDCTQPNIINNYYLWWCSSMLRPHYRCWEIVPHANFMTSNNNYTDVIRKLYYCSTWTLNLHTTTSIHPSCSCWYALFVTPRWLFTKYTTFFCILVFCSSARVFHIMRMRLKTKGYNEIIRRKW